MSRLSTRQRRAAQKRRAWVRQRMFPPHDRHIRTHFREVVLPRIYRDTFERRMIHLVQQSIRSIR